MIVKRRWFRCRALKSPAYFTVHMPRLRGHVLRCRPKKRNAEPRQKPAHLHGVIDPLLNPGSPTHRHQIRSKADPSRTYPRVVTLAEAPIVQPRITFAPYLDWRLEVCLSSK